MILLTRRGHRSPAEDIAHPPTTSLTRRGHRSSVEDIAHPQTTSLTRRGQRSPVEDSAHLLRILLTQPCDTCSCRLISHGLTPCSASCRISTRRWSGSGRPLVNTRPYWLMFFPPAAYDNENDNASTTTRHRRHGNNYESASIWADVVPGRDFFLETPFWHRSAYRG